MGHLQVVRIEIQSDGQQAAEYILIRKQYAVWLSIYMYLHYDKLVVVETSRRGIRDS